jgi:hypothetical protein
MSNIQREREKRRRELDKLRYALRVGYWLTRGEHDCQLTVPPDSDLDAVYHQAAFDIYDELKEENHFCEQEVDGSRVLRRP